MKNNKGITLVALVVTIIVLLILASVSITMLLGENGIITKTREASSNYEFAANEEQEEIDEFANALDDTIKNKVKIKYKLSAKEIDYDYYNVSLGIKLTIGNKVVDFPNDINVQKMMTEGVDLTEKEAEVLNNEFAKRYSQFVERLGYEYITGNPNIHNFADYKAMMKSQVEGVGLEFDDSLSTCEEVVRYSFKTLIDNGYYGTKQKGYGQECMILITGILSTTTFTFTPNSSDIECVGQIYYLIKKKGTYKINTSNSVLEKLAGTSITINNDFNS